MKALILMTRIPIPGKTKTRLMDIFTGERCAELHECFLLDLFNMFYYIKNHVDIFLTYTPEGSLNIIEDIVPDYIKSFPQIGEDLGVRMSNAIEHVLKLGYSEVILIGSDIPDIQPGEILEAFSILKDNDICLGPTFDGGYYLIGMKKPYRELFNSKLKWGRNSVLEGTMDISNNLGLSIGLAAKHMDIDTKEDLYTFKDKVDKGEFMHKPIPENTISYLNKCWGEEKYAER
ncbi:TIGR04282 family arsenosugar biosynthesis glycosyltransferase [Proteiniborus sp.]|uniref:TIGR04282 family arsenosugar biosynthesis glycosyltransferase n=1 Tax=Proteiniborus sp. TaxID=2079015 RepID=UPI0033203CC4